MKRKMLSAFVILLAFAMLLSACEKPGGTDNTDDNTTDPGNTQGTSVLDASVVRMLGHLLVSDTAGRLYSVSVTKSRIYGENGAAMSPEDLMPGMSVSIKYKGGIAESYPAQVLNTVSISVTGTETERVSLYFDAVKHIYSEDTALNGMVIALDLKGVKSFDSGDKAALQYLLFNEYFSLEETQVILADSEMLSAQGKIVDYSYTDGVIITIEEGESDEFSIKKWRSGDGAVGYTKCKAQHKDGEWQTDYGEMFIS
ncbi:MAG: hypothetical protein GX851_03120 [Clostridiales bacterium]|nr:hypothetical protein [Clostridiales bacterium]